MARRFHSAVIDVPDLEVAAGDYTRLLGQPPSRKESGGNAETRSVWFALTNGALELRARSDGPWGQSGLRLAEAAEGPAGSPTGRGRAAPAECCASELEGGADRHWWSEHISLDESRGIPVEWIREENPRISPSPAREGEGEIDPDARIRAIDHVVILSAAPDQTRAFYRDGLGLRLALDKSFEARKVRLLFFRVGGVTIEVGARLGGQAQPDGLDRFGGLAWQVPRADAIQARLRSEGFDVSEVRDGHKPGTRVCTVRDPVHGVPTLLIQPVAGS